MRIIAGSRKGRQLTAPAGKITRPTADRIRQTLFDMLLHAPWGGTALLNNAHVLDAFAGTGALALEALSRGAADACFFETDRSALTALHKNIADCRWQDRCTVLAKDVTIPPKARISYSLLFIDPPYRQGLPALTLSALAKNGWISQNAIAVIETAENEPLPLTDPALPPPENETEQVLFKGTLLAQRKHGAACLSVWQL